MTSQQKGNETFYSYNCLVDFKNLTTFWIAPLEMVKLETENEDFFQFFDVFPKFKPPPSGVGKRDISAFSYNLTLVTPSGNKGPP